MRGKSIVGPALATYLALILCVLVPLWLHTGTDIPSAPGMPWIVCIMVLTGLRFSLLMGSREKRPYEMVFWVFSYVFLGMAPYVQLRLGVNPSTTPDLDTSMINTASVIILVGCAAAFVGSLFSTKGPTARLERTVSPGKTKWLTVSALLVAGYYVSSIGLANLFSSRFDLNIQKTGLWGPSTVKALVTAFTQMSLLVAFVALSRLKAEGRASGLGNAALRWLVLIVLLICANPISTPRYIFGTVLLAVAVTWGAYATQARYRVAGLATIVGIVVIFPLADLFRLSADAKLEATSTIKSLTSGDFDSFAQVINTASYVAENGIDWGRQLLGVALFWIPSNVWKGKPGDTGALLADFQGYSYSNLSAPLWAELFIGGGWVLLILGMLVAGYWMRRLDRGVDLSLSSVRVPGLVASILPFYLLILLRGSLLSAVAYLAVIVVCSWFVSPRTKGPVEEKLTEYGPARALKQFPASRP